MKTGSPFAIRVASLFRVALVSIAISSLAFFIYARFVSPTAIANVTSYIPLIVLGIVTAFFIGVSIVYFALQLSETRPVIARNVPSFFLLVIFGFWMFGILQFYSFTINRVLSFLFVSAGIWLFLNSIVYVTKRSNNKQ
jgi:hypothetical protein